METNEHPNVALYRRTADSLRAGDLVKLATFMDPEVIWHVPGRHPMAGDVIGRDALVAWLAKAKTLGFWLTEHDVLANDAHVCAISHMGARRDGLDIETRVVSIFHFRDGHQAERWLFPEDADIWDQIFDEGASGR